MAWRIDSGIRSQLKNAGQKFQRRGRPARAAQSQDREHLALIRQLPCLISGQAVRVQAAHIRYANAEFSKPITGGSTKPDDKWTVPLSAWFHTLSSDSQHEHGEEGWWMARGINPLIVASQLYASSSALRSAKLPAEDIVRVLTQIVLVARKEGHLDEP
ncbi:hypothetical protein [Ancylobacter sp.]|uniref:hypothetical protein n=1 Tax=Ancylobacter sp. TaxID=1872567 RepID=UPI003D09B9E3